MKKQRDSEKRPLSNAALVNALSHHIQQLLADLRRAKPIEDKRYRALEALKAVIEFLDNMGMFKNEELTEPLEDLVRSLIDVQDGHSPLIFEQAPIGHRPKAKLRDSKIVGYAAAAMELYMRSDLSLEAAGRRVAGALGKAGFERMGPRGGSATWVTVKNWRSKVSGAGDKGIAKDAYDKILDWPDQKGQPPEQVADRICDEMLPQLVRLA